MTPFLGKILDGFDLYDDDNDVIKISPTKLEEIIFKTGNAFRNYMPACWDGPPDWEFKIEVNMPRCIDDPDGSKRLREYANYDLWEDEDWKEQFKRRKAML